MRRAWPPLLKFVNWVKVPELVVMVALPAVAVSVKEMSEPPPALTMVALPAVELNAKVTAPLLVMVAVPAVDELSNSTKLLLVMRALPAVAEFANLMKAKPVLVIVGAFDELLTMPLPWKANDEFTVKV